MQRRQFIGGAFAAAVLAARGAMGAEAAADAAKALVGGKLPKWEKGHFRIHAIYTGRSEATLLVFPDSTSMLIDCGEFTCRETPHLPEGGMSAGEAICRYIMLNNPNGRKVDYFALTHYHTDHTGERHLPKPRSANGKYSLSGMGRAIDMLDFTTFIDRSWPDMNDPAPRKDGFDHGSVLNTREVFEEAVRRGIKVEKFRLEKGSDQIRLMHGGSDMFSFTPLCARGRILRRDGSILKLSDIPGNPPLEKTGENPLSVGMIFSHGPFRYFTAGDFEGKRNETALAAECPRVEVVKANHHGHKTMCVALLDALRPKVTLACCWHRQHMESQTMNNYAAAKHPGLVATGFFPPSRKKEKGAEKYLHLIAKESFSPSTAVIDVEPDGKHYTLMMTDARRLDGDITGAYRFETSAD